MGRIRTRKWGLTAVKQIPDPLFAHDWLTSVKHRAAFTFRLRNAFSLCEMRSGIEQETAEQVAGERRGKQNFDSKRFDVLGSFGRNAQARRASARRTIGDRCFSCHTITGSKLL
jgi:hypothetical protein